MVVVTVAREVGNVVGADGRRRPEFGLAANGTRDGQNEQGEGENGRRLTVEL